jgi:hypothetical protein
VPPGHALGNTARLTFFRQRFGIDAVQARLARYSFMLWYFVPLSMMIRIPSACNQRIASDVGFPGLSTLLIGRF